MHFLNRTEAGQRLAHALLQYRGSDVIVFALPRGGVVVAAEIAKALKAPIDLILAHKIGHPFQPEYAIGALSESGYVIGNPLELESIEPSWFESEKEKQMQEIKRKRIFYLKGQKKIDLKDKIAIIVDDGIATGFTMLAGIQELKQFHPKKIIVAVPVSPSGIGAHIKKEVDEFVCLNQPDESHFLGAIGAYYDDFSQTTDQEVIEILKLTR